MRLATTSSTSLMTAYGNVASDSSNTDSGTINTSKPFETATQLIVKSGGDYINCQPLKA